MKKAAVMLYPLFSLQEISCVTELFKFYDKEIVTFSVDGKPVASEDGFTILPDRDFSGFDREEFDCLVLPGIWEPLPVLLDGRNIRFLEQFRGDGGLVIAAISAAPLLLGKAGLLEGKRFTHGVYEEFLDAFPVMPREGIVRIYLVEDDNLITAHGGAFREFAAAVGKKVGLDCPDEIFSPMAGQAYEEEDFIFHIPPEDMEEIRADWDRAVEESRLK
jgi:4-methyl-5(b-hydroxyethyl)-thiazole monophosphate biosynthesis